MCPQCIAWYGASALASIPAKLTLAELKPFPRVLPRQFTVSAGNTVAVECPPPISYPPPVIQYYKNDERLPGNFFFVFPVLLHNCGKKIVH